MRILLVVFLIHQSVLGLLISQEVNPKKEYSQTLLVLSNALQKIQILEKKNQNYGAIQCRHCDVLHTRAAESVFPFAVSYKITGDKKYLRSATAVGNWLIRQQENDGSWKETPEEWTGTTTDQLLMMMLSFEIISPKLNEHEKKSWLQSMEKAADYLTSVMSPEFASINYVATTTSTLAQAYKMFAKVSYLERAKELAHRTIAKMDEDGFINGEGGRSNSHKYGVDLGYDMEMSLWGLGYYAKLEKDTLVNQYVKKSLKNHIYFIYPDGSMDGSWGIRSNKWTTYGGATSDGCQVLFSLYADDDPRYANASLKNLEYLKTCMRDGIVGYGPHHWQIFESPPCIYPTFAKAKNLAFAYELENKSNRKVEEIPTEIKGWIKFFNTLDVVEVRTKNFMSTITSYGYEDHAAKSKSKYMYRPSGGAISNLWLEGHGFLQASSVTNYSRPEPMHFPEAPGIQSLTPRIEFTDSMGYFTNLFEFDSNISLEVIDQLSNHYKVKVAGEMKDKNWSIGGVAYQIDYDFTDNSLRKKYRLIYHGASPIIKIVEPFIEYAGMEFKQEDDRTVLITTNDKKIKLKVIDGDCKMILGMGKENYWSPYPALKAYPVELIIQPPQGGFIKNITLNIEIL